jgi:hypothetical protein
MTKRRFAPAKAPTYHELCLGPKLASHLQHDQCWIFDQLLDPNQELHGFPAVHDAVIVTQRDVHHRTDGNLTIDRNGTLFNFVQSQDADLRRVQNRRTEQRAKDPAVGDGEASTLKRLQRQSAVVDSLRSS